MRLLHFFLCTIKPFRGFLIGLLVCVLIWALALNAQPFLIKHIVNSVTQCQGAQAFSHVGPLVALYVFVCVPIIMGSTRVVDYMLALLIPRHKEYILLRMMDHVLKRSFTFYQRYFSGSLSTKINDIATEIPDLLRIFFMKFLICLLTLALALVNLSLVNSGFALAMLVWLGIFMGGSLWMLLSHGRLAKGAAEARSKLVGYVVDILINVIRVRLFNRMQAERLTMKRYTGHLTNAETQRDLFFLRLRFFQSLSFWIFESVCFWWLLCGFQKNQLSAGDFILVFNVNSQILHQFWSLGKEIRDFWLKVGYIQQALDVLYAKDAGLRDSVDALPLAVSQGSITFEHVHFFYEGSPPLFQNKTLHIPGKQRVGLVGYSGSGKSTIISLILRLYTPTSGRILIDETDIQHVTHQSLYDAITIIPQDCMLLNRTIMENIRYGKPDATDEEVFQAAERAQIHDTIQHFPQKYNTVVGERGGRLSGGQRQRIIIASAILKNTPILLMDEVTSQLDMLTEQRLEKAFEELMQGKTTLVIAHRLSTLQNMDRLLVFDAGKIVQDGTHEALLRTPGLYQNLWKTQNENFASPTEDITP